MPNSIGVSGLQRVPQTQYPEPTDERELSNEDASKAIEFCGIGSDAEHAAWE